MMDVKRIIAELEYGITAADGSGEVDGAALADDLRAKYVKAAIDTLRLLTIPETNDFMAGVEREAAHQILRWGTAHDAGKGPLDWFWLLGYLGQKAAAAAMAGDIEKAKHHTISSAAMLLNWHRALSGTQTAMRPGIDPPTEAPQ